MVLKVYLHYLIREAKHDCVPCSHPLFDINWWSTRFLGGLVLDLLPRVAPFFSIQVTSEMLQQCHLLVKFLRVLICCVGCHRVLFISKSSFYVVEVKTLRVQNDLGRVIKVDSSSIVAE